MTRRRVDEAASEVERLSALQSLPSASLSTTSQGPWPTDLVCNLHRAGSVEAESEHRLPILNVGSSHSGLLR